MNHLQEAVSMASRAVEFDKTGCAEAAVYFYREAARCLKLGCLELSGVDKDSWATKAKLYEERADSILSAKHKTQEIGKNKIQDPSISRLQRCKFLLSQALDADEAGHKETAIKLYTEAIESSLAAKKETDDPVQQSKLTKLMHKALERAEELKGIKLDPIKESGASTPQAPKMVVTPQASSQKPTLHRGSSAHLKVSGAVTYTEEEKQVLLATSRINKLDFVPFMSVDLSERFQYAIPFTDKEGFLSLSPKQMRHFSHWARPEEFTSEPRLIQGKLVDYFSIKQTIVSDCSFVASLAVSALYEKKFKKRLITTIIYPRNSSKEPIYNPFGKYMVKLHLNGVPRKVIIDDYLPIGKHGELLCSFSTNRNELWISLLEKAYMKVMGGYNFPGSNSNIDLHTLTGWIPERIAIRLNEPDFNSDSLFDMLLSRLHTGDVLATVATGEMPESYAERAGLVPTHAYAVLDIRKINGHKLLQLKNPWSHVRWKGKFSELDEKEWTPYLKEKLNFDPKSAAMFDNGVFWIDFNSILHYFDVFYLSWNPSLFKYTYCIHQSWSAGMGPVKDAYNIGDNPQFRLSVSETTGSVWILLSRHITDIEDFKENREYITVLVYKNNGKRVYYPNDPPPYIDGVRINSPHYLAKIVMKKSSEKNFTLVLSQYEKMNTIFYTLRAYATCPIEFEKIVDPYKFVEKVKGEWREEGAGGCRNHPLTYPNNPAYKLTLNAKSSMLIDLKGPKQYQVGFEISPLEASGFEPKSTGAYRSGFSILEIEDIPEGTYKIVPTTFYPKQESEFFLTLKSVSKVHITRIK